MILLYEGCAPPADAAAATEALVLHGCSAEAVAPLPEDDAEEAAWELSISDAEGAIYGTNPKPDPNPDPDPNLDQARSTA